jgi:hypothetical protein
MFNRRVPQVPHADLIDLLLDADDETRKLLIFQALQAGSVKKSDAEEVMASVARLERAAAPRSDATARQAIREATERAVTRAA